MSVLVLVELLLQLNILARTSALTMCVTVTVAEAGTVAALTQAAHDRWAAPKVCWLQNPHTYVIGLSCLSLTAWLLYCCTHR